MLIDVGNKAELGRSTKWMLLPSTLLTGNE
jgi:hypothetical protein